MPEKSKFRPLTPEVGEEIKEKLPSRRSRLTPEKPKNPLRETLDHLYEVVFLNQAKKAQQEMALSRLTTQITLDRVKSFDELWAPSLEVGEEKFRKKTLEVWREFATPGKVIEKGGMPLPDLDGRSSLFLLKETGFRALKEPDYGGIRFTAPSKEAPGAIHLDTGRKEGVVVPDWQKRIEKVGEEKRKFYKPEKISAFIDHHGEKSEKGSSTIGYLYGALKSIDLLDDVKNLEIEKQEILAEQKEKLKRIKTTEKIIQDYQELMKENPEEEAAIEKDILDEMEDLQDTREELVILERKLAQLEEKLVQAQALESLVQLVTDIDNYTFPKLGQYFRNSDRTILGLYTAFQRQIDFGNLEKLLSLLRKEIRAGKDPRALFTQELSPPEIEKLGLKKQASSKTRLILPLQQKDNIKKANLELDRLEQDGFVVETNLGKMAIDLGGRVPYGQFASLSRGIKTYLNWNGQKNGFFLATLDQELPPDLLPQGECVRGQMWLKPPNQEPLRMNLKDLLSKVTGPDFKPRGKLKEYLESLG